MALHNCALIDEERYIFSVCSFATVSLPALGCWKSENLNEPTAIGATFYAFDEDTAQEAGYSDASITIADVTNDPSEPYIPQFTEVDLPSLDAGLRADVETQLMASGRQLIQWMPSLFNRSGKWNSLITPYIASDHGLEQQVIMVRTGTADRKFVAIGMFAVAKQERLAQSILHSLSSIQFNVAH